AGNTLVVQTKDGGLYGFRPRLGARNRRDRGAAGSSRAPRSRDTKAAGVPGRSVFERQFETKDHGVQRAPGARIRRGANS
ncbi:hypothetical protein SB861_65540, partial [Paraburkholderia sp. SIMBA_049]